MPNILRKRTITPQKAVKILKKNGIECDENQAKTILDFLYFLAKLSLDQYFNEKKD